MSMAWLDHASDWAENNDIPLTAYRDDEGVWCARLELRDHSGWYSFGVQSFDIGTVPTKALTPSGKPKRRKETGEEYHARVFSALTNAVRIERERRIRDYTGVDPRHSGRVAA